MSEAEQFLKSSLDNVKGLIDVNKGIGNPIILEDGRMIIPVSEVKLCYISGGSQIPNKEEKEYPFGGASAGNLIMRPVGFVVISNDGVESVNFADKTTLERLLLDELPKIFDKIKRRN